ncbi:hypothetical protein BDV10DRAFT_155578 [Aspergillus recurvatus]
MIYNLLLPITSTVSTTSSGFPHLSHFLNIHRGFLCPQIPTFPTAFCPFTLQAETFSPVSSSDILGSALCLCFERARHLPFKYAQSLPRLLVGWSLIVSNDCCHCSQWCVLWFF